MMKRICTVAAILAATAIPAFADGKSKPMMEPVVVADAAVQDSAQGPIVMGLAILTVFGAALSH